MGTAATLTRGWFDISSAGAAVVARLYKGTSDGRVLISDDGGRTWRQHTNFGPQFTVQVSSSTRGVYSILSFQGKVIYLKLGTDGKRWYTVSAIGAAIPSAQGKSVSSAISAKDAAASPASGNPGLQIFPADAPTDENLPEEFLRTEFVSDELLQGQSPAEGGLAVLKVG